MAIPVESEGIVLEGVWQAGTVGGAVVAPPHPEMGGSLDHPVANELAYALYKSGYASIRFNWRGVGGSQGAVTGDTHAAESDYRAALAHLIDTVEPPYIGAGYSFGAIAAIRVALEEPRVKRLLLVAPPFAQIRELPLDRLERPVFVIVGAEDPFAPRAELSELLTPLPNFKLEVIARADHFFAESGLGQLMDVARAALD